MKPTGTYARNSSIPSRMVVNKSCRRRLNGYLRIRSADEQCHSVIPYAIGKHCKYSYHADPGESGQANAAPSVEGRNFFAAASPSAMNAINTIPCATPNGGSDWVGPRGWKNGTF